MATSHYFNNYNSAAEQNLLEDFIVESIKIMGFDAHYIPNTNDAARDLLYGEDPLKKFTTAFPLEMYLSSALEYGGDKEFFSKFGLEIRNNVNVIVSRRSFNLRGPQDQYVRPLEGDLVWIPFLYGTGELYEIKFVDATKDFFALGRQSPYFYELQLEKFKFSNEVIDTGVPEVDVIAFEDSYTIHFNMENSSNNYTVKEIVFQSNDRTLGNAYASATVANWQAGSNTLSVINIFGTFVEGANIVGSYSNTDIKLLTYDPLDVNLSREVYDNKIIRTEANSIIDFSEQNPFGKI
jgi:hypothetical protein